MKIIEISYPDYMEKYRDIILGFIPDLVNKANVTYEIAKEEIEEVFQYYAGHFWIVKDKEDVVGFAAIELMVDSNMTMLDYIYLLPHYRTKENENLLFKLAEKLSDDYGIRRVYAVSHKDFGCTKLAERYSNFVWPECKLAAHLFVRRL